MSFFYQKTPEKYDDTELRKQIFELQQQIILLKTRMDGIELKNDDLLNKVLRKIQNKKGNQAVTYELLPGQVPREVDL